MDIYGSHSGLRYCYPPHRKKYHNDTHRKEIFQFQIWHTLVKLLQMSEFRTKSRWRNHEVSHTCRWKSFQVWCFRHHPEINWKVKHSNWQTFSCSLWCLQKLMTITVYFVKHVVILRGSVLFNALYQLRTEVKYI